MADMIVSGAGTEYLNGTWTQITDYNGKSRYMHSVLTSGSGIQWFNNKWIIGYDPDYGPVSGNQYYSTDDVATPDLVTTWIVGNGSPPAPTVTAASSGQSLTLSCAAGSYSLAGVACTLTYTPAAQNLTLSCSAGSLALTGTACTLSVKRNYTLACNAGSYALTGSAVSFEVKRNYVLSCSASSLTLTGAACTLSVKRNYVLSCSAGSYAVTGTSASLTKNLVMACESGGVAYPGMVVSGAGSTEYNGTYAETGTKNGYPRYIKPYENPREGLFIVRIEDWGAATWVISAAGLDSDQNIQIMSGAMYYSEDDVATPDLVTTWIQAGGALPLPTVTSSPATSYALTGSSVTLTKSLVLSCETGSYALTGTDISFGNTKAYELVCGAGSYTLTGLEADLFKGLVMPCGNGSYILTGSPATINSARTFVLGMGSYVLVGMNAGLYILTITPDCRTYFIDAENRTLLIGSEDRTHSIDAENRTLEVRCH